MKEVIIDTNVPLVASNVAEQMSAACIITAAEFISNLFSGKYLLVVDDSYRIISEYSNRMNNQKPSIANNFLKWVYTNQANNTKIKQVSINALDEYNFKEVPNSIVQIGFDNSDRKFIAVAIANDRNAPIVQAADSKWIGWEKILNEEGIQVHFLCKEELQAIHERKSKQ